MGRSSAAKNTDLPLYEAEPVKRAHAAGLRYVDENEPGYTRRRCGHGFSYRSPGGKVIKDPALRNRFKALVIPPAWEAVWICVDASGHIQATGRDARGRKQYVYHPDWETVRDATKFSRTVAFGEKLPLLRERVEADLRKGKLGKDKVTAIALRLLEKSLVRVGNPEYALENQTYGLTTLESRHVEVSGSCLIFSFQGKSNKAVALSVCDARLTRLVAQCDELPGQTLFGYLDEQGKLQALSSSDVNAYVQRVTGESFTAKDFRTWGGTVCLAQELHREGPAKSKNEAEKKIVGAVKRVAERLNNTPAVCRKYYIHPGVLDAYRDGSLLRVMDQSQETGAEHGLSADEWAVLAVLRTRERKAAHPARL
jgi:DNA topoisomerase-1